MFGTEGELRDVLGFVLPDDDEDVALEPVPEADLPDVDPHEDDDAVLVDEEN